MSKAALDKFGMLLMDRVRDIAIRETDAGIRGKSKAQISRQIFREILGNAGPETRDALLKATPIIVDTVLHYVLWMFEDEPALKISFESSGENVPDINAISDGLSGEIFGQDGWIVRFSKQRYDKSIT